MPAAGGPYVTAAPDPGASFDKLSQLAVGGDQAHDNMAPFLTISYIIALEGVYPAPSITSAEGNGEAVAIHSVAIPDHEG